MLKPFSLTFVSTAVVMVAGVAGAAPPAVARDGIYSKAAIPIWANVGTADKPLKIVSPDERSSVSFWKDSSDGEIKLRLAGRLGQSTMTLNPAVNAELEWSPDSEAFFITASDGGNVGNYHLLLYTDQNNSLVVRDFSPLIAKAFGNPVKCFDPEVPNIGGIGWQRGHGRLLLAAEIPPHSNCDSMGTFKAYQVDVVNMHIVDSYSQLAAKQRFGSLLGVELRNADDSCARDASSCYVTQLHQAP
jgi:hypothetical protein